MDRYFKVLIFNAKHFFGKVGSGRAEFALMLFVGIATVFFTFDLAGYLVSLLSVEIWLYIYNLLDAAFSGWSVIKKVFYPPTENVQMFFRTILALAMCFPFLSTYLFLRNKVVDENEYFNNFNCFEDVHRFQSGDIKVFSLTHEPVVTDRLNGNLVCILDRFFLLIPDSDNITWFLGNIDLDVKKAEPTVTIFCRLGDAITSCRLIIVEDRSDPMRVKYLGGGNLMDIKSIIRSNVSKLQGVKECFLRSSQLMTVNKRHQLAYEAMLLMEDGDYSVLGSYLTLNKKSYELLLLTPPEELREDLKLEMVQVINNIKVKGFGSLNEFEVFS